MAFCSRCLASQGGDTYTANNTNETFRKQTGSDLSLHGPLVNVIATFFVACMGQKIRLSATRFLLG